MVAYGPGKELQVDMATVVRNELEILGSNGVGIQDVADMMRLLEQKKLSPVVTRYPLTELNEVIEKLSNNQLIGRAGPDPLTGIRISGHP